MAEAGRPSFLNEELCVKIKHCILSGKNHKETAQECGIPYDTFEGWIKRNYDNFADFLLTYKHERLLRIAEKNIEGAMLEEHWEPAIGAFGPIVDKETKTPVFRVNPHVLKIKTDAAIFVAETIGRSSFHKKQEIDNKMEFKSYEIVRGDESENRPVPETVSGMAPGSPETVEPVAIQDTGSGPQSA